MEHAEKSLLKVTVVSDAQSTGMEVATSSAWLREPPERQACQLKEEEVKPSTAFK